MRENASIVRTVLEYSHYLSGIEVTMSSVAWKNMIAAPMIQVLVKNSTQKKFQKASKSEIAAVKRIWFVFLQTSLPELINICFWTSLFHLNDRVVLNFNADFVRSFLRKKYKYMPMRSYESWSFESDLSLRFCSGLLARIEAESSLLHIERSFRWNYQVRCLKSVE